MSTANIYAFMENTGAGIHLYIHEVLYVLK